LGGGGVSRRSKARRKGEPRREGLWVFSHPPIQTPCFQSSSDPKLTPVGKRLMGTWGQEGKKTAMEKIHIEKKKSYENKKKMGWGNITSPEELVPPQEGAKKLPGKIDGGALEV